jgi:D-sedoheptulose 7-phosphate isomerase
MSTNERESRLNVKLSITSTLKKLVEALDDRFISTVEAAAGVVERSLASGGKLLICGNGGSAADAQHIAAELIGRYVVERRGLPALALTTDTSVLTAWTNDYDYETVFSRQIESLATPKDLVWGISTSGNSKNIVRAFEAARELGATTFGLLGCDGGRLLNLSDHAVVVRSAATDIIQTGHQIAYHAICAHLDRVYSTPA